MVKKYPPHKLSHFTICEKNHNKVSGVISSFPLFFLNLGVSGFFSNYSCEVFHEVGS